MGYRLFAHLSVGALVSACALAACNGGGGTTSQEGTASTAEALGGATPQLQLQVRTESCGKNHVEDVFEVTNTGTTPVPLSAITIELWADDTSGHKLEPRVQASGHVEGDPSCDRDVWQVQARAESFSPACGPDPTHQANWQVTISNADGALLMPGASWKHVGLDLHLDGSEDFSPGTSDWYSGCQAKTYQHTSSYALYVAGHLVTSSTGVPPSCKALHGSQQLTGQAAGGQGNVPIVGPLPASTPVMLSVSLPLTNQAGLQTFLQNAYDPTNPQYRQFLTPADFGAAHGASQSDYDALVSFVQSNGLTVARKFSSRTSLTVTGTAAQVESIFHVTLNVYENPDGITYQAPANEPSVDFAVPLLHIGGLDNATVAVPADNGGGTGPFLCNPTGNVGGAVESYAGADLRNIYFPCNTTSTAPLDGAGQTVALFANSFVYPNDYLDYVNPALGGFPGLDPTPDVSALFVPTAFLDAAPFMPPLSGDCSGAPPDTHPVVSGTPPGSPSNCQNTGPLSSTSTAISQANLDDAIEAALDVEMVLSIAPKAHVILYEQQSIYNDNGTAENNFFPELVFRQMAEDDVAQTISVSHLWYNHSGFDPALASALTQLAAQGQGLFVSAGDWGAYVSGAPDPNVPDPLIDSPFVTAVGGTQLTTTGTAASGTLAYASETTWNDSNGPQTCARAPCNSVTGGGLCSGYTRVNSDGTTATWPVLPLPSYQSSLPMAYGMASLPANPQLSASVRMIPDVSMPAAALTNFLPSNPVSTNGGADYVVYDPTIWACSGGTSASSPMWAAIVALADQQLARSGQPGPIGFANPLLYGLAAASGTSYANNFHDVADGSNNAYDAAANPTATVYDALPGYDLTTGLGSPACGIIGLPNCVTCGGTCATLDTDPNNCGACSHSCQGGACVGGACQPSQLASIVGGALGVATDGTNVYFSDQATDSLSGVIQSVPVGGGATTPIASGLSFPATVAVDGANVYWLTRNLSFPDNLIFFAPKGGGGPTQHYVAVSFAVGLADDGTNVYWGNADGGVFQAPVVTASPVTPLSSDAPIAIAVDSANVYWTTGSGSTGGVVMKEPIGGGAAPSTLANGLDFTGFVGSAPYSLSTDGANVYWVESDGSGNGRVATASISASGGAGTTLAPTTGSYALAVAVDATNVYWVNASGAAVMTVPKGGGAVTTLGGLSGGVTIALDATSVYWSVSGSGVLPASGAIYKVAKQP